MVYPHGRGAARLAAATVRCGPRSIPTGVGQPAAGAMLNTNIEVYPHGRGAAGRSVVRWAAAQGLSPRAWGSLECVSHAMGATRSIPTGVGQPWVVEVDTGAEGVYPHGRGAATMSYQTMRIGLGLSPRAWGSL